MQLSDLYRQMARVRAFELAVADLWSQGLISGEMHLGTGEEAVAAGVVSHLRDGDGLALAHRATPPLVVRGVPIVDLLREFLGQSDGLCGGKGGHMHLFSRSHLAASSGIVGASLPVGAGFALAAKLQRPGSVAVAFIGDGALNQGMALETLNLARAWSLPMVIVCIDNGWAITTTAGSVTGGDLKKRASAFGWRVVAVDGTEVEKVHETFGIALEKVRKGKGPVFLYATCPRLDGHFLGDQLLRQARDPLGEEGRSTLARVLGSAKSSGSGLASRAGSMTKMMGVMSKARRGPRREGRRDPLRKARQALQRQPGELERIEREVAAEIDQAVTAALGNAPGAEEGEVER
jgi:pyruvate dehydrogenase E1 component alpha subunit